MKIKKQTPILLIFVMFATFIMGIFTSPSYAAKDLDGTDQIEVKNAVILDYMGKPIVEGEVIQVTNTQNLFLDANFSIKDAQNGDTFSIKLPDKFDIFGVTSEYMPNASTMLPINLMYDGQVIAYPRYDKSENKIIYTFTKAVEEYQTINAGIMQPIFVDGYKFLPQKGEPLREIIPVRATFGGKLTTDAINQEIDFSWGEYSNKYNPAANIVSEIPEVDYINKTYKQIIVVNPNKEVITNDRNLGDVHILIYGEKQRQDNNAISNTVLPDTSGVHVYNFDNVEINQSLFIDPKELGLARVNTPIIEKKYDQEFPKGYIDVSGLDFSKGQTYLIEVDGTINITDDTQPLNVETSAKIDRYRESPFEKDSWFSNNESWFYDYQDILFPPGSYVEGEEPIPGEVSLQKTINNKPVSIENAKGIVFELYRVVNEVDPFTISSPNKENDDIKISDNLILNDEGKITTAELNEIKDNKYVKDGKLMPGLYYFKETKVPDNQKETDEVRLFNINSNELTSFNFTNEFKETEIPVEKLWADDIKESEKTKVIINLFADGKEAIHTDGSKVLAIELDGNIDDIEKEAFKGSFINLPKENSDGDDIVYTVKETPIKGFEAEYKQPSENNGKAEIINASSYTSITADKIWENAPNNKPDVYFQLMAGDNVAEVAEGSENPIKYQGEKIEWINLAKKDSDGEVIEYTIKEVDEDGKDRKYYGYQSEGPTGDGSAENPFTITNSYSPGKITINAKKVWEGGDDLNRPDVKFQLFKDGTPLGEVKEIIAPEVNTSWTDLDERNEDGKEIIYSIEEVDVPENYTNDGEVKGDGSLNDPFVITNKYEGRSIKVTKKWINAPVDDIKPDVYFMLLADGNKIGESQKLENNETSVEWNDLIKIKDGREIEYSVKEVNKDGTDWKDDNYISGSLKGNMEDGFIIENTFIKKESNINIKFSKEDQNKTPLKNAKITLTGDNGVYEEWESDGSIKEFKLTKGKYKIHEVSTPDDDKYEIASDIIFEITEEDNGNLKITNVVIGDGNRQLDDDTFIMVDKEKTIPPTPETPQTTEVKVTKSRKNLDESPDNFTANFLLYAGDELIGEKSITGNGEIVFEDLPLLNERGEIIEYSVEESSLAQFISEKSGNLRDGFIFTNIKKQGIHVSLIKVDSITDKRLKGAVFNLYKINDGEDISQENKEIIENLNLQNESLKDEIKTLEEEILNKENSALDENLPNENLVRIEEIKSLIEELKDKEEADESELNSLNEELLSLESLEDTSVNEDNSILIDELKSKIEENKKAIDQNEQEILLLEDKKDVKDLLVGEYTTDEKGEIEVKDLQAGDYYFIEKAAPSGYILDLEKRYEFSINTNQMAEPIIITVKNTPINPENPNEPPKPNKPNKPEEPNKPNEPQNPNNLKPNKPNTPEKPDKPEDPDKPNVPREPNKPDKVEKPQNPTPNSPTKVNESEKPGKKLPQTSDGISRVLIAGLVGLSGMGLTIFGIKNKKENEEK